jgi:hypothetical protein
MGTKRTRPYHANSAGAPSVASAEINFGDASQDIVDLPAGAVVIGAWAEVIAAFNGGTTNVLTVGVAGTQSKYLGAADITEGTPGVYPVPAKGPFVEEPAAVTVTAFFAQTGTPATTGKARVYIHYVRTAANG